MRTESVLQYVGPGTTGFVVAAQRRERLPQVTRGKAIELLPKSAGGAAVVSDRDNRGQVIGHAAQRGQGGCKAMPAAKGDDIRQPRAQQTRGEDAGHVAEAHSRPRSRWRTVVGKPVARRRSANSSAIAELRCLPPVQPMASVANRLPSVT